LSRSVIKSALINDAEKINIKANNKKTAGNKIGDITNSQFQFMMPAIFEITNIIVNITVIPRIDFVLSVYFFIFSTPLV
jgi:hypothetical protein